MYKKLRLFIILMISFFTVVGCSLGNRNISKSPENVSTNINSNSAEPEKPAVDPIEEKMSLMTLEEKIGQMLIVGVDGYAINGNSKQMIDNYHVGGFILYSENVASSKQLLTLINSLKTENNVNKIPLFFSVDEEGGRVSRMPRELSKFPSNAAIGKLKDAQFSNNIGSTIGDEIKAFGFNMDFAPVLDIYSNSKNTVIGDRSFGSNEKIVSELGLETMKGIQSQGIIPVVKHFPGHGDTSVDSHIGLPTVNNDLNRLRSFELVPFDTAIKNDADAVMVAHILLPKIDSQNPASLSEKIITDILRKELNFNGVVITDDMTMGAIIKNMNINDAAVKSVNAGNDIILVAHGHDDAVSVINALKEAVESGKISEKRIDESVYRILKLKQKYNLDNSINASVNVNEINEKIKECLKGKF